MGIDGKDDTLPLRLVDEPVREGQVADAGKMEADYYELRCRGNAVAASEKLKELETRARIDVNRHSSFGGLVAEYKERKESN